MEGMKKRLKSLTSRRFLLYIEGQILSKPNISNYSCSFISKSNLPREEIQNANMLV